MRPGDEDPFAVGEETGDVRPPRRLISLLLAAVALIGFAVAIWYAYRVGRQVGSEATVPLIAAEQGPAKVRPPDPGGLEVPHQDKLVYRRLAPEASRPVPEQLLPPPEEPLPKPPPLPPEAPPARPTGSDAVIAPSVEQEPADTGPALPLPKPSPAEPESTAEPPASELPAEPPAKPQPQPPAAPPPSPPQTAPAASGYRVQLASFRSEAEAREAWRRLQRNHAGVLGKLQLRIERADLGSGRGIFYRVQAGPLSERTLAEMVCSELKSRNVGCLVVSP